MTAKRSFYIIVLTMLIALTLQACGNSNTAKLTFKVVDDEGEPVFSARVDLGYWNSSGRITSEYGYTNSDGFISLSVNTHVNKVSYGIYKDRYYVSSGDKVFPEKGYGRWKPWNPTINILLRNVINPVPMFARNNQMSPIEIPVIGERVGFDLINYDWVSPYGNGKHNDIIFYLEKNILDKSNFNAVLKVTFDGSFNGIQEVFSEKHFVSSFKLLREAPVDGYKNVLIMSVSKNKESGLIKNFDFSNKMLNYYFRIRSEEDNGKLVKAMYGKVLGPIIFDPVFSETAKVIFQFYLNPDYTRNLEFDPQRNLFENLPDLEKVGIK